MVTGIAPCAGFPSKQYTAMVASQIKLMLDGYFRHIPNIFRCQIQEDHSELVSLLPRDLVPCAVCVQTITGHLTVNSAI